MPDTRPNILWICTDQQRRGTVHSLGNEHIRTPHVDRLVREGVAFTRCYSQSPICTPSRASFLTGYYPSTLHVNRNGDASHANMIVDGRHKLCVYHGHSIGELYDLQADPCEFRNLWNDPAAREVKWDLLKRIFDATMLATDPGQPRVGYY